MSNAGNQKRVSAQERYEFLEQCYDRYRLYVYKLAWQFGNPKIEVEDLVQEVWAKLCTKADKLILQSSEQQLAYISATVRNTAISLTRQRQIEVPLENAYGISYNEADVLNCILDRRLSARRFQQIWPHIPQSARELLERKYLLDESDTEIARAMGIGTNSVRMYLSRARKTALAVLLEYKEQLI